MNVSVEDGFDATQYEKWRLYGAKDAEARENDEWSYIYCLSKHGEAHVEIMQYLGTSTTIVIPEKIDDAYVTVFMKIGNDFAPNMDNSTISDIRFPNCLYVMTDIFDDTGWYQNQPDGIVYAGNVVCKYKGEMPEGTSITIKEGTTGICSRAFFNCSNLKELILPDTVVTIMGEAFMYCKSLEKLQLSKKTLTIQYDAFKGCSALIELYLPVSLYFCYKDAFSEIPRNCLYYEGSWEEWDELSRRCNLKVRPLVADQPLPY